MRRQMFITVGTSLFHSASWEPTGELENDLDYPNWANPAHQLHVHPEQRRARHEATVDRLKELLKPQNSAEWVARLPEELRNGEWGSPEKVMRFSAELATVLKMGQETTPRQLLQGCNAVHVIADPNDPDRHAYTAAVHLTAYLNEIAGEGGKARLLEIPGLSSRDPARMLGKESGLPALVAEIQKVRKEGLADEIDLVATGGYKIFGVLLAQLVATLPGTRLAYLHELGDQLLLIDQAHVVSELGGQYDNPAGGLE